MTFKIKSNSFEDQEEIPDKFTCNGENISPELEWFNPPPGTKSFVLLLDDYDAPGGIWNHWVIYNIPANINQLEEAITSFPEPIKIGKNSWKNAFYEGPCPPDDDKTHHYHFKLFALSDILNLANATRDNIENAIKHYLIDKAILIGTYKAKNNGIKKDKYDIGDALTILNRKDVSQEIKENASKEIMKDATNEK